MPENAQIPAAQKQAENPSKAAYTDSNRQSDTDALNGIQFSLACVNACRPDPGWSPDEIDADITYISEQCQFLSGGYPISDPFRGLNASDAAKLIAGLAEQLHALYPQPITGSPQDLIVANSSYIISACKDIDPSSVS